MSERVSEPAAIRAHLRVSDCRELFELEECRGEFLGVEPSDRTLADSLRVCDLFTFRGIEQNWDLEVRTISIATIPSLK